ncbi:IS21 family transposase, partial [Flammeovirga aprica]
MAGQRIEIMDIRQLIQFKTQNYSNRKIAKTLDIHRNTVNTYVKDLEGVPYTYQALLKLSDQELSSLFTPLNEKQFDRYSHLMEQMPSLRNKMKLVGATLENVWKDYLHDNPKGYKYTQFTKHYRNWCKQQKVSLKLDHKSGEQMFVDFTGKHLQVINPNTGEVEEIEVFVAILPSSQYTFMTAVRSQKQEDFFDALNQALRFFGGVPKAIVTDNLKAAVAKITKGHTYVTKAMKLFASHYNCSAFPTRPYSPQDKALVEGAVKLCYQRIFYPLQKQQFFSLSSLNSVIRNLLSNYNKIQFSHRNTSRLQEFLDYEKKSLTPLPISSFEMYEFSRAKVQKMGYAFLG